MNDTSEENMVYYPAIDGRKERQIEPSVEILSQSGIHYFFSPGFKTSDITLELVVKKYGGESRGLKSLFRFYEKETDCRRGEEYTKGSFPRSEYG